MSTSEKAQNDLKKLKSTYASELSTLKELFTDWTDDDLVFALQDADGDLELAIDRISEGHASQWGEVKTKKSKKEAAQAAQQQQQPVVIPNNSTKSQEHRPTKLKQRLPQQKNWSSTKRQDDWSKSWSVEHKKPSPSKPHTDSKKTWASLLHTPTSTKESPPLQKVDDAWLTPSNTPWENEKTALSPKKQVSKENEEGKKEEDSLPDFGKLSLIEHHETSINPTVNDLFNSVQPSLLSQEPITTTADKPQLAYSPSFGLSDYSQQDYSMYNHTTTVDPFQSRFHYQDKMYGQEQPQQPQQQQQHHHQQPQQQQQQQMYSYPYYYMPNQFNQNGSYPVPLNRTMYPPSTSTTTTTTTTSSSSYTHSSPYTNPTQSLYGFHDFGLQGYNNSFLSSDVKDDKSSPQQVCSQYFGQSTLFQPYRSNNPSYWNQ